MKLFKSLLVAPATLGLLAPMSATAKEITINDFTPEVEETLLAGGEGLVDDQSHDGSFSDTTTLSGKAIFTLGGVENSSGDLVEGVKAQYTYQMNLNTSFTGDDDLYVRLKTGNGGVAPFNNKLMGTYLSSTNTNGDTLKVDKIWYSFPLGDKITAWVGPKIENYYMHGASPSIYKPVLKGFKLGGNGAAYGASTDSGLGFSYNADNGFSISSNLVSDQNGTTSGFLTNQVDENWSTQIAYTKPNYHASLMVALKYDGWADEYYSTTNGAARGTGVNSTNYGLRGYWRPDNSGTATPEISVGYDFSTIDGAAATADETDAYFVGLTWKDMFQADDKIGLAFGQPQTREDETTDPFMWEAYYSFKVNDSMTVTPAVFGGTDVNGSANTDVSGAVIETTFKF